MSTAVRLRLAFVSATAMWAVALVVAPFLATRAHATIPATALVAAVYGTGSLVCHQLAARSFHLWGAQMPVCARCTGIYAGAAALAPMALWRATAAPALRRHTRLLLAAAILPSAATLAYEWTTGITPPNVVRFAAGVPLGAAVAWLLVAASKDQVN